MVQSPFQHLYSLFPSSTKKWSLWQYLSISSAQGWEDVRMTMFNCWIDVKWTLRMQFRCWRGKLLLSCRKLIKSCCFLRQEANKLRASNLINPVFWKPQHLVHLTSLLARYSLPIYAGKITSGELFSVFCLFHVQLMIIKMYSII